MRTSRFSPTRRLLLFVLPAGVLLFSADSSKWVKADEAALWEQTKRSVVLVKSSRSLPKVDGAPIKEGAGFIVDQQGTIITNFHIVNGADSVAVKFFENDSLVLCDSIAIDAENDLAAIRPASRWKTPFLPVVANPKGFPPTFPVATKFFTFGHVSNVDSLWSTISGQITHANRRNPLTLSETARVYQAQLPAVPGFSGGPVVIGPGQLGAGKVLGVVSSAVDDGRVDMTFIIPASAVLKLKLDSSPVPFSGDWTPQQNEASRMALNYSFEGPKPNEAQNGVNPRSSFWGTAEKSRFAKALHKGNGFGASISPQNVQQLIDAADVTELFNDRFRFWFFVPRRSSVSEVFDAAADRLTITITTPGSVWPMIIEAESVKPLVNPTENEMVTLLDLKAEAAVERAFGGKIVGSTEAGDVVSPNYEKGSLILRGMLGLEKLDEQPTYGDGGFFQCAHNDCCRHMMVFILSPKMFLTARLTVPWQQERQAQRVVGFGEFEQWTPPWELVETAMILDTIYGDEVD